MQQKALLAVALALAGAAAAVIWCVDPKERAPAELEAQSRQSASQPELLEASDQASADSSSARKAASDAVAAEPAATDPHAPGVNANGPPAPPRNMPDASARLVVLFLSQETGLPLEGLRAYAAPFDGKPHAPNYVRGRAGGPGDAAVTGADGRLFLSLPPDSYRLAQVGGAEIEREVLDLQPGEERNLTLSVPSEADALWRLAVVDDTDAPLEGAVATSGWDRGVHNATREARTDAAGEATLSTCSWLHTTYRVAHPGHVTCDLTVPPHGNMEPRTLIVRLFRHAALVGRVVDLSGRAVQGAVIEVGAHWPKLEPGGGAAQGRVHPRQSSWTTRSGADGEFELRELTPTAELDVKIKVGGSGIAEFVGDSGRIARRERLELTPGEERVVAYAIEIYATVRGVLLDESGSPLGGVELSIQRPKDGEGPATLGSCTTDLKTGAFAFTDIPPGEACIVAANTWFQRVPAIEKLAAIKQQLLVPPGAAEVDVVVQVPAKAVEETKSTATHVVW